MIYRVSTRNGAEVATREYIAGSAMTAGDVVAHATDDEIDTAAANATAALGWVTGDITTAEATANKKVNVIEADDNTLVEMPFTGTFSAGMIGGFYGLTGTTGAQKVNLDDTTNDLFKLVQVTRNGTATGHASDDFRCLVLIPSSKSQATGAEA